MTRSRMLIHKYPLGLKLLSVPRLVGYTKSGYRQRRRMGGYATQQKRKPKDMNTTG